MGQITAAVLDPLVILAHTQQTIAHQCAAAQSSDVTPLELAELAASPYPQVRDAALANPAVPTQVLAARYTYLGGMAFVARSFYLDLKGSALRHDLHLVLGNPACPAWVCIDVATHRWPDDMSPGPAETDLQHLAASNHNCPPDIVDRYYRPVDGWEPWLAAPTGTWDSRAGYSHHTLLKTLHWPQPTLELIATRGDFNARAGVAENPYCSPAVLQQLAADSTKTVSLAVAGNPNTPPAALDRLLRHREPGVSQTAYNNPNLSATTRAMWQLAHNTK